MPITKRPKIAQLNKCIFDFKFTSFKKDIAIITKNAIPEILKPLEKLKLLKEKLFRDKNSKTDENFAPKTATNDIKIKNLNDSKKVILLYFFSKKMKKNKDNSNPDALMSL